MRLRPGDLVPSVRELSKQLVVNPNTVARAYRDLQTEGLLETVRGMGLQVAEGAVDRCRTARREMVRQRLRRAIEEARRSRMDPSEIEAIFREEWARAASLGNGEAGISAGPGDFGPALDSHQNRISRITRSIEGGAAWHTRGR